MKEGTMAQQNAPPVSLETPRTIVSRPVGSNAVLTVIGSGDHTRGPWPYVTGVPNLNADMVGPPAQYLSVAAWAA